MFRVKPSSSNLQCKPPNDHKTINVIYTPVGTCIVKWSGQLEVLPTWKWSFKWSCCASESMYPEHHSTHPPATECPLL